MWIECEPSAASSRPSPRSPVPASKMTRVPFADISTHVVFPPVASVSGPGVASDPRQPQIFTRIRVYASQKKTMIPWNSPSGPSSGKAVVATSRSAPSRPVMRRDPWAGRRWW